MKLLLVGSDNYYAIENFYVKYLRESGVEVLHFPARTLFYKYYQKGLFHQILFRAGLSGILNEINVQFKSVVLKFKPEFIWVFKGMEMFPSTLKWAKDRGIRLINYNGDSPFIFQGRGSGNKNVTRNIGLYDLFLTYSFVDKNRMESERNIKSAIIPFGFDINEELYEKCERLPEIIKTCFLGNPDAFRTKFLISLADEGIEIDVYGEGWKRYVKHPRITVFDSVRDDEFWVTLRKYRIQLNLMRLHNPTTHNMRTFEAAGVGAIQLAPDTPDHRDYFKSEAEIFLFSDLSSCIIQIKKLLNFSAEEALKIRNLVRVRALQSGYTYQSRARHALTFIKELQ